MIGSGASTSIGFDPEALQSICRHVRFEPGDVLRQKGQHYRDMYLMTDGCVDVNRELGGDAGTVVLSKVGSLIGEIGFLRGWAATATVIARAPTGALLIDDMTLARLEKEQPRFGTAAFLRHVAAIAEQRTSDNVVFALSLGPAAKPQAIEVVLCRDKDMLERAQRLRYEVYCEELGRYSPHADHQKRIIADDLDATGHTFLAIENGETIGTMRANAAADGHLGMYEEVYGMKASPNHPSATAICTKFIVKKARRGGPASIKLISAVIRYGLRQSIKEVYIDCIPALLPYYKAIGFTIASPPFLHRENGPSTPMMLDMARHAARLSTEWGVTDYLSVIMKAKAISMFDRLRGHPPGVARS